MVDFHPGRRELGRVGVEPLVPLGRELVEVDAHARGLFVYESFEDLCRARGADVCTCDALQYQSFAEAPFGTLDDVAELELPVDGGAVPLVFRNTEPLLPDPSESDLRAMWANAPPAAAWSATILASISAATSSPEPKMLRFKLRAGRSCLALASPSPRRSCADLRGLVPGVPEREACLARGR